MSYERHYYAGCDYLVGQAALDRRLGLQPGQVTAGLAALLALSGVELAFGRAAAFLEEVLQLRLSENTIRKETECFGQLQGAWEQEQQALSQDPHHLQARRRDPAPPERLYGSLDGAQLHIEPRHQEKKSAEADPSAEAATTYFTKNAQRMNYAYFREQGYMIGSGPIESGCKQIVSQRLKCSGAQWHVPDANRTTKARAAWLSGTWARLCDLRDQLPLAV